MKIILTGSTGWIGSGVLQRCISHPSITSIVALTRRPIEVKDPKLNNIVHKDFLNYDQDVLDQLKGAEGCIWCVYELCTIFEQLAETEFTGSSARQHLAKRSISTTPTKR